MKMFDSEKKFADYLIANNKTYLFQPPKFKLKKTTYRTDFYCPEDDTYYEVIGTRQAYHSNKNKIKEAIELYPGINFKVVHPNGTDYRDYRTEIKMKGSTVMHIRIELPIFYKINDIAEKESRTNASIIRQAIKEFIKKRR